MSTFFYLGPIRTSESQRAINAKKVAVNDFVGSIWIQINIFTPNVDQIIQDSDEIFLLSQKLRFFEKWPQVTLLDEFNVEKLINTSETYRM